jgi:hypothetical protein
MAYGVLFNGWDWEITSSGVLDRAELDTLVTGMRIMLPQDRIIRTICDTFVVFRI